MTENSNFGDVLISFCGKEELEPESVAAMFHRSSSGAPDRLNSQDGEGSYLELIRAKADWLKIAADSAADVHWDLNKSILQSFFNDLAESQERRDSCSRGSVSAAPPSVSVSAGEELLLEELLPCGVTRVSSILENREIVTVKFDNFVEDITDEDSDSGVSYHPEVLTSGDRYVPSGYVPSAATTATVRCRADPAELPDTPPQSPPPRSSVHGSNDSSSDEDEDEAALVASETSTNERGNGSGNGSCTIPLQLSASSIAYRLARGTSAASASPHKIWTDADTFLDYYVSQQQMSRGEVTLACEAGIIDCLDASEDSDDSRDSDEVFMQEALERINESSNRFNINLENANESEFKHLTEVQDFVD